MTIFRPSKLWIFQNSAFSFSLEQEACIRVERRFVQHGREEIIIFGGSH